MATLHAALAAALGVDERHVRAVDQALLDAGLRDGLQGRAVNHSPREIAFLLLGMMGTDVASRAGRTAADFGRFKYFATEKIAGTTRSLPALVGMTDSQLHAAELVSVIAATITVNSGQAWLRVERAGIVDLQIDGDGFVGSFRFTGAKDFTPGDLRLIATVGPATFRALARACR